MKRFNAFLHVVGAAATEVLTFVQLGKSYFHAAWFVYKLKRRCHECGREPARSPVPNASFVGSKLAMSPNQISRPNLRDLVVTIPMAARAGGGRHTLAVCRPHPMKKGRKVAKGKRNEGRKRSGYSIR